MVFAIIAAAAAAIALVYFALSSANATKTLIVDVIGAVDGRTIEIMIEGKKDRVILAGIGFPRGDQKSEQDSLEAVNEVVVGRRLLMEVHRDVEGCKYVSLKSANGDCLNAMMLKKGMARYESMGVGFLGDLIAAENEARSRGIGVWDKNRALYKHLAGNAHVGATDEIGIPLD